MSDLAAQYRALARYNTWMNERLYALCATLPDEVRKEDRGAFFRSIHGTLNHLLLTDRAWLGRFTRDAWLAQSLDESGKPIAYTGKLDQVELYAGGDPLLQSPGAPPRPADHAPHAARARPRGHRPGGAAPRTLITEADVGKARS